ncbi:hypothetical protein OPT61_g9225 [Boeremia exigua]|uniref:Uncharacterized protein n=1 Tax=Boeremia exigua TaxID=749465 RepID=A0ACC2HVA7_9PLEO|nr:hypothetical protein OPT61_g9225 [Boeremia exigua]
MRNLLDLAREVAVRNDNRRLAFLFVSSIGAVGCSPGPRVLEERLPLDVALPNGYGDAKWVCERLLDATLHKFPHIFRASVVRPGQIAGSSTSGFWNPDEHFAFMVKSAQSLRAWPDLRGTLLWTPVDHCGAVVADLALNPLATGPVYHMDNPVGQPWETLNPLFARLLDVPAESIIPFRAWIKRVRTSPLVPETENPTARNGMADFLEKNFERMSCGGLVLDTQKACEHSATLAREGPTAVKVRSASTGLAEFGCFVKRRAGERVGAGRCEHGQAGTTLQYNVGVGNASCGFLHPAARGMGTEGLFLVAVSSTAKEDQYKALFEPSPSVAIRILSNLGLMAKAENNLRAQLKFLLVKLGSVPFARHGNSSTWLRYCTGGVAESNGRSTARAAGWKAKTETASNADGGRAPNGSLKLGGITSLQSQLNKQLGCNTDRSPSPVLGQTTPSWDTKKDSDFAQGNADLDDMNHTAVDLFSLGPSFSASSMLDQSQALVAPAAPPTSNLHESDWAVDSRRFEDPMLGIDLPTVLPDMLSAADMTTLKLPYQDRQIGQPCMALFESDEQHTTSATAKSFLTEYERADLDQVFFDRVHPVLPLFYRRNCHGWREPLAGTALECLRSAMRTIAAAMSAPGAQFCDQLYAETRRLLEDYSSRCTSTESIELNYIQTWLLLGFYELLRVGETQAMLTAARCSRLVLMARLFEIDAPDWDETRSPQVPPLTPQQRSPDDDSFCVVEERRRTFWLAYCLDCFLYARNDYPPMMQEDMICTRLPAPEANFQNNQAICTPFLADIFAAKAADGPWTSISSLAECMIVATLYAKCSGRRSTQMTQQPGIARGESWARLKHLAGVAKTRLQILAAHSSPVDSDPMLLFAHMVARGAVIKLGQAATSALPRSSAEQQQHHHHRRQAFVAAAEMASLTRQITHFSYFTVHPFLPDPLACAIGFLNAERGGVV